jgi:hypothetical protein
VLRVERFSHRYIDSNGREISSDGDALDEERDRGLDDFWFSVLNQGDTSS